MVRKVIGYLLLCCFSNLLTTLPAKCCELGGGLVHRHAGDSQAHSQTILQYLFDIADEDSSPDDNGVDVHCSVFNESRPLRLATTHFICAVGKTSASAAASAAVADRTTFLYSRPFPLPHHHNFLFRLTPF